MLNIEKACFLQNRTILKVSMSFSFPGDFLIRFDCVQVALVWMETSFQRLPIVIKLSIALYRQKRRFNNSLIQFMLAVIGRRVTVGAGCHYRTTPDYSRQLPRCRRCSLTWTCLNRELM